MTLVNEVIVGILLAFWLKNRIGSGEIVATSLSAELSGFMRKRRVPK
jgi:hypothetical protein